MCSTCGSPPAKGRQLLKCGACHQRTYCSKVCQKVDWKLKPGGHKGTCGKPLASSRHDAVCVHAHNNVILNDENHVASGQVLITNRHGTAVTTGLNTCMFIVVRTELVTIAWHAKCARDTPNIQEIKAVFRRVGKKYGRFERGFVIPGVDRDEDLNLKPTCRTMRVFGPMGLDPRESKEFILGLLGEFDWSKRLEKLAPPEHYKDFIVIDRYYELPWAFSDVSQFDKCCTFDAERD